MASEEMQNVRALLATMPNMEDLSIEETRAYFDQMGQNFPLPDGISISSADADGWKADWVRTENASQDRAILYLHGGGYIIGSLASHRHLAAALSQASGASVLALDYRLAPEHPFPAAVEDAVAAYQWLLQLPIKANHLAIAGDSAGGGLTIATLLALRDKGIQLPACGVCLSPWVDLTNSSESYQTVVDSMLRKEGLDLMAQGYLQGQDAKTPLASPLYADLQGLPPLLVQVGTDEVLYSEAISLEAKAKQAGVAVTLEVWDEMIHVWHFFYPILEEGREAIARIGEYVKGQIA
jgi:monoterpene epsilon-lactone hydrolase